MSDMLVEFGEGRFTDLELLAEGRQAHVYRARQSFLDRTVALKVVRRPELEDEIDLVDRLHIEGVACLAVSHPNLVRVHDGGVTEEGDAYLVMEFLDGETVASMLANWGPFVLHRALDVAIDAAEALDALHGHGIIHADVNPNNIVITHQGQTKVIDLGLAYAADAPGVPEPRELIGTAPYVCPHYAATRGVPDVRTDIYSLGATLCSMILGLGADLPVADGSPIESATTLRARCAPSLEALRKKVPAALAAIIKRAMAPDPEQRFPSIRDFLGALREQRSAIQSERNAQIGTTARSKELKPPVAETREAGPRAVGDRGANCTDATAARISELSDPSTPIKTPVLTLEPTLFDLDSVSARQMREPERLSESARSTGPSEPTSRALACDADTPAVGDFVRRPLEADTPVCEVLIPSPEAPRLSERRPEKKTWTTLPCGTMAGRSIAYHAPIGELPLSGPATPALGTVAICPAAPLQGALVLQPSVEPPIACGKPSSGTFQTPAPEEATIRQAPETKITGTVIHFKRRNSQPFHSLASQASSETVQLDLPAMSPRSALSSGIGVNWSCLRDRERSVLSRYWPLTMAAGAAIALVNGFSTWSTDHAAGAHVASPVLSTVVQTAQVPSAAPTEPNEGLSWKSAAEETIREEAPPQPASSPIPVAQKPTGRKAVKPSYRKLDFELAKVIPEKLEIDFSELVQPWSRSPHQPQPTKKTMPPSVPKRPFSTSLHNSK